MRLAAILFLLVLAAASCSLFSAPQIDCDSDADCGDGLRCAALVCVEVAAPPTDAGARDAGCDSLDQDGCTTVDGGPLPPDGGRVVPMSDQGRPPDAGPTWRDSGPPYDGPLDDGRGDAGLPGDAGE